MEKFALIFALIFALVTMATGCKKDKPIDLCENTTCYNGGSCVEGNCNCPSGFTGANCQTAINPCATITCYNGGTCVNGVCSCPPGYSGANCQTYTPPATFTVISVTINYPPADNNLDYLSGPDLTLYISPSSNTQTWEHITQTKYDNYTYPVTIYFTSPFSITNQNYDVELTDYDIPPDSDDVIVQFYGTNLVNKIQGNKIPFIIDGHEAFSLNIQ